MDNLSEYKPSPKEQEEQQRLFPNIPAWIPQAPINLNAKKLIQQIKEQKEQRADQIFMARNGPFLTDENTIPPSGYTYLGQFIAHELTFLNNIWNVHRKQEEINSTSRIIPKLNLNTLYGSGPAFEPQYFNQCKYWGRTHFKTVDEIIPVPFENTTIPTKLKDLNRQKYYKGELAIPLIPDNRNDENIVISQLHLAFQLAHNRLIDHLINIHLNHDILEQCEQKTPISRLSINTDQPISKHGTFLKEKINLEEAKGKFNHQVYEVISLINHSKKEFDLKTIELTEKITLFNTYERLVFPTDINQKEDLELFLDNYFNNRKLLFNKDPNSTFDIKSIDRKDNAIDDIVIEELINLDNIIVASSQTLERSLNEIRSAIIIELDEVFERAKKTLQWHFQWIVLHDFLPKIIPKDILHSVYLNKANENYKINLNYFLWEKAPYLPREFSIAFFRFGHSMVRPNYTFNTRDSEAQIFAPKKLNRALKSYLNWKLFFPDLNNPPPLFNRSNLIDPFITPAMVADLGVINRTSHNIVFRNLERGRREDLPSGQDIAKRMVERSTVAETELESATTREVEKGKMILFLEKNFPDMSHVIPTTQKEDIVRSICNHSPLWFYTLMEAHLCTGGNRLGPVAGRIVAEVLAGIIEGDNFSFLSENPNWYPHLTETGVSNTPPPITEDSEYNYSIIDLLKFAQVYEIRRPEA